MAKRRTTEPLFPSDEDIEEATKTAKEEVGTTDWPSWFDKLSDPDEVKASLWKHIKALGWDNPTLTALRLKGNLVPNLRAAYQMYGKNDGYELVKIYQDAAQAGS